MKHSFTLAILCLFAPLLSFSQTVLKPGDMAIVALNADAPDVWAVVTFVDLTVGTKVLFTDNGYERTAPNNVATGLFANSEEVLELEVTGSTVPAGTVITYDGSGANPYTSPGNFIHTMVATNSFASPPLRFNQFTASGDCIFIMQGTWFNGTVPGSSHDATLTGTLIWGHNAKAWEPLNGSCNSTSCSRLPPSLACMNNAFNHFDNYGYLNSAPKTGSLASIITALKAPGNWGMNNSTTFTPPLGLFNITSGLNESIWTGNVDTDWFNCANWDNLRVPTPATDAVFPVQSSVNNIVLQAGDSAHCRDFTINDGSGNVFFAEGDISKVLYIHGDLSIDTDPGSLVLDFDDGNSGIPDGVIHLYGNWTNNSDEADFVEGNSRVNFVGNGNQNMSITTGQDEIFFDLIVNKPSGDLVLVENAEVLGQLDLSVGKVNTGSNFIYVNNPLPNSVINHNNASYVNGFLRREIQTGVGTPSYDFPVGNTLNYELATFDFVNPGGISFIEGSFSSPVTGAIPNILEAAILYDTILNAGFWVFNPNGSFSGTYDVTLNETGYTNGLATSYINVKRPNATSAWNNPGTHNSFSEVASVVTCKRDGLAAFSDFAIALPDVVLPVILKSFQGSLLDNGNAFLTWESTYEWANKGYRLEHRQPGADFQTVDWQDSKNNRNGDIYSFEHLETSFGINFYRLIQLDLNGKENDLGIVEIFKSQSGQLSLAAFPNPFAGSQIQMKIQGAGQMYGKVYTMQGKFLGESKGTASELSIQLPKILNRAAPGTYFVQVRNQTGSLSLKVMKID